MSDAFLLLLMATTQQEAPVEGGALDLATAVWDSNKTSAYPASSALPYGVSYRDDGLEVFLGNTSTSIQGFDLAAPFTPPGGTISGNGNDLAVSVRTFRFFDSGSVLWVNTSTNFMQEYSLGTPYDLSTASLVNSVSLNVPAFDISNDGLNYYEMSTGGLVTRFDLGSPFDVTSISSTGDSFNFAIGNAFGVKLSNDGTRIYIVGATADLVSEFILATPFIVGSAGSVNATLNVGSGVVGTTPTGLDISPDQTKLIVCAQNATGSGGGSIASFTADAV